MISVIIPVFNRAEKVLDAIHSVLSQTYTDYELIVVNDGSTADFSKARELVTENGHRFIDISWGGVARARNIGVKESRGKYLAFLDSDDSWLPEKLQYQIEYLESHPEIRICQCEETWYRLGKFVNPKNRHKKPSGDVFESSLELCLISPSAVMLERSLFDEVGGFNEKLLVCEDYDLWLRITKDYQVETLPKAYVIKNGGHDDQLSRSKEAIDRFRIYSMLSLYANNSLTQPQQEALLKELIRKAKVVADGAKKRGLLKRHSIYSKLSRHFYLLPSDDTIRLL